MKRFLAAFLIFAACDGGQVATPPVLHPSPPASTFGPLVEDVQKRAFLFFWETTNPANGLVPDRWPTPAFSSIAAVGFGLTAYGVGAERGWVTREAAAERVLTTLRFFRDSKQGDAASGVTGYRGFYYHFVDMKTGERFEKVELSTIDTTLLLAGALFCQSYFDRQNATEKEIREIAEQLYRRAEWPFFFERAPLISMGWTPENGLHDWDYHGYNEAMILYILAIGSPTHPVGKESWDAYTKTYRWEEHYGYQQAVYPSLFIHQYSHVWIDFRGIQDDYMRAKGIDYFENSRRATYAQRAYAIDNPMQWKGYGENVWGLTACDGPVDGKVTIDGRERQFWTYRARGPVKQGGEDDGTLAPTAAVSSIVFAPEIAIPAIEAMHRTWGANLYQQYGFLDSFNPTLSVDTKVQMGKIIPGVGWFDHDYLGIDQGPIVAMIENYRSELIWKTMRKNPHIVRGLKKAGFVGGWLEAVN
ncbi:MAG TPA: glucoamylase family protein [Thermoanaerobaculia bacterium]|jgi:hypothetical protein|nr:glucoamylase family protein [Thermoanaerobaculia bacterium]